MKNAVGGSVIRDSARFHISIFVFILPPVSDLVCALREREDSRRTRFINSLTIICSLQDMEVYIRADFNSHPSICTNDFCKSNFLTMLDADTTGCEWCRLSGSLGWESDETVWIRTTFDPVGIKPTCTPSGVPSRLGLVDMAPDLRFARRTARLTVVCSN